MADNSRHQHSRDRQNDRSEESERSKRENRQNSGIEMENQNTPERGRERHDRFSTMVPDNYERDSE